MAVGGPQQLINVPSGLELAGGPSPPVVTPSAVTQMSEALRQGFLTADDIIARTGKRAQLKEKADVMALTEIMSPKAVQARQAGLTESLSRSQLGAAQAQAALPLVHPTANLTRSDLEEKQAEQTYGTGITAFKALSSEAGIAAPLTPEGKPDWEARAKLGIDLIKWKQNRDSAKERLMPAQWKDSADGTQLLKFNKMGELISRDLEQTLARQALQPFQAVQPGTAQVEPIRDEAPAHMIEPEASVDTGSLRAELINSGRLEAGAALTDEELLSRFPQQPTITPRAAPAVTKPVIETAPAVPAIGEPVGQRTESGFSLGPAKASAPAARAHYTETQQKALGALTRGLATEATLLNKYSESTGFNPASLKSQVRMGAYKGGILSQIVANFAGITEPERAFANAADAWVQGLLRAESGAAIATKEQQWYERTFSRH